MLSVSKLTTDDPCYFVFDSNGLKIMNMKTNRVLASGNRLGGLYALDDVREEAYFSNRFQATGEDAWYQRLEHPQARVLLFLKINGFISVSN